MYGRSAGQTPTIPKTHVIFMIKKKKFMSNTKEERERERERERETETETDRDRDRQTDRQRQRDKHTDTQTHRDTQRDRDRQTQTHRERSTSFCLQAHLGPCCSGFVPSGKRTATAIYSPNFARGSGADFHTCKDSA